MSRLLAILAFVSTPVLFGAPFTIYGTGMGPGGAIQGGKADPYYTVTPSYATDPASVYVATQAARTQDSWTAGTNKSKWITPDPSGTSAYPNATFDYTTTFDLTGVNSGAVVLSGRIAADDLVSIFLNGQLVGTDNTDSAWAKMDPFTIGFGFLPGLNTLTFEVTNFDGATGLDVALDPSITPEPASFGLMGAGLLAAVGLARFSATIKRSRALASQLG